jgi:hypothetical protein
MIQAGRLGLAAWYSWESVPILAFRQLRITGLSLLPLKSSHLFNKLRAFHHKAYIRPNALFPGSLGPAFPRPR